MMKVDDFIMKLELARRSKTLYVMGCFGAPLNDTNKKRYTRNHVYNMTPARSRMIKAASSDTFGFDCVCLIKSVLWEWDQSTDLVYGGAIYKSNGVPDVSADGMIKLCKNVSTDFSTIKRGEAVWMSGHIGVYIGDGKVIECTPKWLNCVQYSNLGNIGYTHGNCRYWKKHGFLPWVEYETEQKPHEVAQYYTVKKGDTLTKIAKTYNVSLSMLMQMNSAITNPNKIFVGQKIRVK